MTEGRSLSFGPDLIHRLTDEAASRLAARLLAPAWRLGQYSIDGGGVMRRVSVC